MDPAVFYRIRSRRVRNPFHLCHFRFREEALPHRIVLIKRI